MGGDHGHSKIKVPDYTIYKTETVPELMAVKRALAQKGLSDPWLRNEVWKYDRSQRGSTMNIWRKTLGRGVVIGLVAAIITTAAGKLMDAADHGHDKGHH